MADGAGVRAELLDDRSVVIGHGDEATAPAALCRNGRSGVEQREHVCGDEIEGCGATGVRWISCGAHPCDEMVEAGGGVRTKTLDDLLSRAGGDTAVGAKRFG